LLDQWIVLFPEQFSDRKVKFSDGIAGFHWSRRQFPGLIIDPHDQSPRVQAIYVYQIQSCPVDRERERQANDQLDYFVDDLIRSLLEARPI
jgi:hypothetical protein